MGKKVVIDLAVSNEPVEVEQTAQEIADLENIHASEATKTQAEETAKQVIETNKASGNQKLLDLGLSQAEATALTGYTPPVAE